MTDGMAVSVEGSTVTVTGQVDHQDSLALVEALLRLVDRGGEVVVDMRGVTFIDSTGVSALITARGAGDKQGASLVVLASTALHRTLTTLGLSHVLGLAPETTD